MKKLTNYLLVCGALSIIYSGFLNCLYLNKSTVFVQSLPNNSRKYPSFNFDVESPFVDSYGYYSLEDTGHSINDYISSMELDFNQTSSTLLLKAPYLTYTSEDNRYYSGSVVDTKTGTTPLGPYDTWSLEFNDQPYIVSSSDISVLGYHADTFINYLSFSLSGNSACTSNKYYLQNLNINISIPNNVTSLTLRFNKVYYSSSYHEVVDVEDVYVPTPPYYNNHIENIYKTIRTSRTYTTETVTFTTDPGFSFTGFSYQIYSGISRIDITSSDLNTGTVTYTIYFSGAGLNKTIDFQAQATSYKPAGTKYDKTITTTYIDTFTISSPTVNITKDAFYRYPSYLLSTLNCSGRGDEEDRSMVIDAWDDLEEAYLSLPSTYQSSFSNGTLDDPYLLDALMRYDYVVFFKQYGLTDFASRSSNQNRYYSRSEYKPFVIEKDNTIIVVIIASVISILPITTLTIFIVRKKTIQQE